MTRVSPTLRTLLSTAGDFDPSQVRLIRVLWNAIVVTSPLAIGAAAG